MKEKLFFQYEPIYTLTRCRLISGDNSVRHSITENKKIYRVVVWFLLFCSMFVLIRLAPVLVKPEILPSDDFFHFWAAGNLNLQEKDPFDPQIIDQLRIQQGSAPVKTLSPVTLNPPWAISLLMPFGLLRYPISRFVWLIFSIVLILLSAQMLWRIYSGNSKQRWLPILMVFVFAPTISVLEKGQITPLVLVGITGFLYFSSYRRNDWLAGIFLALASIKPQMIVLFWIVLLFWIIQQRRWLILISTAITVLSLVLLAMIFNPHIIQQYIGMLQTYHVSDWAVPTIGSYLRFFWFGIQRFWLQFLPVVIGVVWLIYYWYRHHKDWNWLNELPIILLISMVVSPYSWTYDLVILIPAMVLATIWIATDWKRWTTLLLVVIFFAISVLDMVLHMKLDEFWFIWVAPALLIWFLLVRWQYPKSQNRLYVPAI
jgi:hypothetical protein